MCDVGSAQRAFYLCRKSISCLQLMGFPIPSNLSGAGFHGLTGNLPARHDARLDDQSSGVTSPEVRRGNGKTQLLLNPVIDIDLLGWLQRRAAKVAAELGPPQKLVLVGFQLASNFASSHTGDPGYSPSMATPSRRVEHRSKRAALESGGWRSSAAARSAAQGHRTHTQASEWQDTFEVGHCPFLALWH